MEASEGTGRLVRTVVVAGLVGLVVAGVVTLITTRSADEAAPTGESASSTATPPTTEQRPDPADVVVTVANGSGVSGLAGRTSETLSGLGYVVLEPTAISEGAIDSNVYYRTGAESAAEGVAEVLGLPSSSVAPLPNPSPVSDVGGADVVVVLGADFTSGRSG